MNEITITQMMERAAKLKAKGEHFTLMGIGPMSYACIEATLECAKERDFPVMLIASRNQVDGDDFGHGYVCDWDQKRFVKDTYDIAEKVGFDGLLYFCRDHGGPWQRDEERKAKLETEKAIALGNKSYVEDMEAGFHLLHIDPTKDPHIEGTVPLSLVLDRTIDIIEYREGERKRLGLPSIGYEVGTEETNGGLTGEDAFREFITELLRRLKEKGLPKPEFIVGQTGTLTRLTENVGHFNFGAAKRLSAIAEGLGVGIKQHNSDYLRDALLLDHPYLGVTAANIAPEFGVVETKAYLELAEIEKIEFGDEASDIIEVITREAVKCERWRKWMVTPEEQKMSVEEALASDSTALITEICGHYTFETPAVKAELAKMTENLAKRHIDAHAYAVKKIRDSIERYAYMFNQYGLTEKLLNA